MSDTVIEDILSLPIVCLTTANFGLTISDIVNGRNSIIGKPCGWVVETNRFFSLTISDPLSPYVFIIDLWTTRCTRCPAALDFLNDCALANPCSMDQEQHVQYVSICCGDSIDGAREIIEAPPIPRWNAMRHFFMAFDDKERAKQLLNFRQVPFYVALDRHGKLVYSGNKKPENFDALFQDMKVASTALSSPTSTIDPRVNGANVMPEFFINDMDF